MFVKEIGTKHESTKMCKEATARLKLQEKAKEHARMKDEIVFTINGKPIEMVDEFKYLGKVVTEDDDDEVAVKKNIVRAREKW